MSAQPRKTQKLTQLWENMINLNNLSTNPISPRGITSSNTTSTYSSAPSPRSNNSGSSYNLKNEINKTSPRTTMTSPRMTSPRTAATSTEQQLQEQESLPIVQNIVRRGSIYRIVGTSSMKNLKQGSNDNKNTNSNDQLNHTTTTTTNTTTPTTTTTTTATTTSITKRPTINNENENNNNNNNDSSLSEKKLSKKKDDEQNSSFHRGRRTSIKSNKITSKIFAFERRAKSCDLDDNGIKNHTSENENDLDSYDLASFSSTDLGTCSTFSDEWSSQDSSPRWSPNDSTSEHHHFSSNNSNNNNNNNSSYNSYNQQQYQQHQQQQSNHQLNSLVTMRRAYSLNRMNQERSMSRLEHLDVTEEDLLSADLVGVSGWNIQTGIATNKQRELMECMSKETRYSRKLSIMNRASIFEQIQTEKQKSQWKKQQLQHQQLMMKKSPRSRDDSTSVIQRMNGSDYDANLQFKLHDLDEDFNFEKRNETTKEPEWQGAFVSQLFDEDVVCENKLYEPDQVTLNQLYEEDDVFLNPLFEPQTSLMMYQSPNIEYEEEKLVTEIKDSLPRSNKRVSTFVVKKGVFSGSELVNWIQKKSNFHMIREDCVLFAQQLMDRYVFKSAIMYETEFVDSHTSYYRFVEEYTSDECLNTVKEQFGIYRSPQTGTWISKRLTSVLSKIVDEFSDRRNENDRADRLINHFIFDYRGFHDSDLYIQLQKDLAAPLHKLDPDTIPASDRKAFFINVYNAFILHALMVCGRPTNLMLREQFFKLTKIVIGRWKLSLDNIYHGILRGALFRESVENPSAKYLEHQAEAYDWLNTFRLFTSGTYHNTVIDNLRLEKFDPRIHFALYCGNLSSPKLAVFSSENIEEELEHATKDFISHFTYINTTARVLYLHKVFQWYASDFAENERGVIDYVSTYLDVDQKGKLSFLLQNSEGYTIQYQYDWKLNNKLNAKDVTLFDEKEVQLELGEVLQDPSYREYFYKFCEKEHSTENIDFYNAIQKYKKCRDRIGQIKSAKSILRIFLLPNSEKEVNVSQSRIKRTIELIEEASEQTRLKTKSETSSSDNLTFEAELAKKAAARHKKKLLLPVDLFDRILDDVEPVMADTFSRFKSDDLYAEMVRVCVTEFIIDNLSNLMDGDFGGSISVFEALKAAEEQEKQKEEEKEKEKERKREVKTPREQTRFASFLSFTRPFGEDVTMTEQEQISQTDTNFQKVARSKERNSLE